MRILGIFYIFLFCSILPAKLEAANLFEFLCNPTLKKIAEWRARRSSAAAAYEWKTLIGEDRTAIAAAFEKQLFNLKAGDADSYRNAYKQIKLIKSDFQTMNWMIEELKRFHENFDFTIQKIDDQVEALMKEGKSLYEMPYSDQWDWIKQNRVLAKKRIQNAIVELENIRMNPNANYEDFMEATITYMNPFYIKGSKDDFKMRASFWHHVQQNETSIFRPQAQSNIKLRGLSYTYGSGLADIGLPRHGELPRADGRIFLDPWEFIGHDMAHNSSGQTSLSLREGPGYVLGLRNAIREMHGNFANYMRTLPPQEREHANLHDAFYFYLTHERPYHLMTWGTSLNEARRGIHTLDESMRYIRGYIVDEIQKRGIEDAERGTLSDFHWIVNRNADGTVSTTNSDIRISADYFLYHFYEDALRINRAYENYQNEL